MKSTLLDKIYIDEQHVDVKERILLVRRVIADKQHIESFIKYLEEVRKKFKKFVIFVDRATQHRSNTVKKYLQSNKNNMKIECFPVGSPQLNSVEECWRQGKYKILSNYYSSFSQLKQTISQYYRTTRFNLDIKKYLLRSTN